MQALLGRLSAYRALVTARRAASRSLGRPIHRVLVVCYGNIYRSAFLGAYLARQSHGRLEIRSSGFHKKLGRSSPTRHIAMSQERGIDLSGHRSSVIAPADIEWADLIIAMDRHNWYALRQMRAPSEKIVFAGALTKGNVEIHDPYQMTDEAARRTIDRLCEAGDALIAGFSK